MGVVVNLVILFTWASNFSPEVTYIAKLTTENFKFSVLRVP